MMNTDQLEGALKLAVDAIHRDTLEEEKLAEIGQRISAQLIPAISSSAATLSSRPSTARSFNSFAHTMKLLIATSLVMGGFAVTTHLLMRDQVEPDLSLAQSHNQKPTQQLSMNHFALLTGVHSIAFRRPNSTEPEDVIVVCEGPAQPIELGQRVAMPGPPNPAQPMYIHLFDLKRSTKSRVMSKPYLRNKFVITPDGKSLLCQDGTLVDLETEQQSRLGGDWSGVNAFWFASPNRLIQVRMQSEAQHDRCTITVLSYPDGKVISKLIDVDQGCTIGKWANAYHPVLNGECAIAFNDHRVHLTSVDAFKQRVLVEKANKGAIDCIVRSPDGKLIASSSEDEVLVHDAITGKFLYKVETVDSLPQLAHVGAMEFSPNGKYLAIGTRQRLVVYDGLTGKRVQSGSTATANAQQIFWQQDNKHVQVLHGSFYQRLERDGPETLVYPLLRRYEVDQISAVTDLQ